MATSAEFKDFVLEQCQNCESGFSFSARKMFGEYCVYLHESGAKYPLFLLCDEQVFVKKFQSLSTIIAASSVGVPFEKAKEWFIVDIDDLELLRRIILAAEPCLKPTNSH